MYEKYRAKEDLIADADTVLAEIHKQARSEARKADKKGQKKIAAMHRKYIKNTIQWVDIDKAEDDDGIFVMKKPPERVTKNITLRSIGDREKRKILLPSG